MDYRDLNGKRIVEKVSSKHEGEQKLADITKALRQGSFDPGRAKNLLQSYAIEWLQGRRAEIAKSTFTSYEYVLRVHILPG